LTSRQYFIFVQHVFTKSELHLSEAHYYFKLDPNIRNTTEVQFGKMEIEGLLKREVNPIKHFYDVIRKPPVSYFDNNDLRIQDFMLNLRTAYGNTQGYYFSDKLMDLSKFIERLAYTREIYVATQLEADPSRVKRTVFPFGIEGTNYQVWTKSVEGRDYCLFRIITNMFFLEQLNNVVLCSAGKTIERQEERMSQNITRLVHHITLNVRNYVPKFPKDANWKEFEDFVDEPNEITLYLTQHYGPPYKAKFHPRMIRSLLNFSGMDKGNITGDFMLGSGTLAIESVLLGLDTKGSDINPLTKIVVNAKIDALSFDANELLAEIDKFFDSLPTKIDFDRTSVSPFTLEHFSNKQKLLEQAVFLNRHIRKAIEAKYQNFFLCALARVVSVVSRKKNAEGDILDMLHIELRRMWKIIYSLNQVKFLHLPLGKAEVETDDIRKLSWLREDSIDLIITSPPYSTAIDYVKMDLSQLLLLELIDEPKQLDESMMGTHRKTSDIIELGEHIDSATPLFPEAKNRFHKLPKNAQEYIMDLKEDGNEKNALRCYKFLYDMWDAMKQMYEVLRKGGKCIIIIGNNVFTVRGEDREFRNGDFLEEIALNKEVGFAKWREKMVREYSKSSYGTILKEDIIFLEKPT